VKEGRRRRRTRLEEEREEGKRERGERRRLTPAREAELKKIAIRNPNSFRGYHDER